MKYLHQLDYIKAFAILSVILLHTIPYGVLISTYSVLHIWQVVPLFVILMGFNLVRSKNEPDYNLSYFHKRYQRVIKPFIPIFSISLILGFLLYRDQLYLGWLNLMGLMPKSGPGNYYITMLIQFILIAPVIYKAFSKRPKMTIMVLFLMDLAFQIFSMDYGLFDNIPYLYNANIIRYLSALALGMWISKDYKIKSKRNIWIMLGSIFSFIYLILGNAELVLLFDEGWRTQNILSFFYPTVLVMLGLRFLPNRADTPLLNLIGTIGKASYHIFLIQMIYFALIPTYSIAYELTDYFNYYFVGAALILFNLFIVVTIGLLFYKTTNKTKETVVAFTE